MRWRLWGVFAALMASSAAGRLSAVEPPTIYSVGVAQVDITPAYPVRLSGFAARKTESEGVTRPIWAKALAISTSNESPQDAAQPLVLIAAENLGIPADMCDEVARRLTAKCGLPRDRLAITATHTHTAPMVRGVAPTLFGGPIPPEHQRNIDRYTAELTDKLEQAALAALADRRPAKLTWGVGTAKFAVNRRVKGGPVDGDLPVLVARETNGDVRAIWFNYACHCVTLSGNKISGDWAGFAMESIQRNHPGAIALCSVGCGGDLNPNSGVTGDKADVAAMQGGEIAAEVKRLVDGFLAPVSGELQATRQTIELEFAPLPAKSEWEESAKLTTAIGYHARVQLERLTRGESLPTKLDYAVSTWTFGDSLAMVFLPGEAVVDYSLRLKRELDGRRLWVNAYANGAPCYIPSERILKLGGYEAGGAMVYYDRPGPLKSGVEQQIVDAVKRQASPRFAAAFDAGKTQGSLPLSPQQSLAALQTTPNLQVDLVAAEPLVTDPVAIDFGLNGELWVAEMHDYPAGGTPEKPISGRIRVVRDADGDGTFDASTIFLNDIPYPTGVTVWRKGVLVCAAPDILYAEDTDGDDKADIVKKLFTGFGTGNLQARVNGLCYGRDGWVYGSCGLFGGVIENERGEKFNLGDRDFRIDPDAGRIEAATGQTQQGRVRDDAGNWFGCDNTTLAVHYPLAEHYLRRNPYVVPPAADVTLARSPTARKLLPARSDAQLFELSGPLGAATAACGLGAYRDTLLGAEYRGNLLTCEPVNLLVHRLQLFSQGTTFRGERAKNEANAEILRSTDGWFRPVQAVTGPDGGLWVVDMYRNVIEHPRWIPPEDLAQLDVRAGDNLGRIYRLRPAGQPLRAAIPLPWNAAAKDAVDAILRAIDQPNGPTWDRARQWIEWRQFGEKGEAAEVDRLVAGLRQRNQTPNENAIWLLEALNKLVPEDLLAAIGDARPEVRALAIRLSEKFVASSPAVQAAWLERRHDDDAKAVLQVAYSLGEWSDPRVGETLAKLAIAHSGDPYLVAGVFSSVNASNLTSFTKSLFDQLARREPPPSLVTPLLATAVGYEDDRAVQLALDFVAKREGGKPKAWQLQAMRSLIESLGQDKLSKGANGSLGKALETMRVDARRALRDSAAEEAVRIAAVQFVGSDHQPGEADFALLADLLSAQHSPAVQTAAVSALGRRGGANTPALLIALWRSLSPGVQLHVVDTLMARDAWVREMLAAVGTGLLPASCVDAPRRTRLVTHEEPSIRRAAQAVLGGRIDDNRRRVIAQYGESLALAGDVQRGRALFAKSCSQCHRLGDTGHAVGPDLAPLAVKSPAFLLQEMLDPNRNVDTRYASYSAVTRDGRTLTGLLAAESAASLTLLGPEAKQLVLPRQELEELRATDKSLMPEGLEKDLSPQAVADIIALLRAPARAPAAN